MIGMSNIPSFIATTESERAARENRERAAIEAVAGPGPHHAGLSNERQTAESRSSYRAGYDQITWTVDQLAAAEKELEKWRAKEAVRKSAAYFASLGAAPCPKCQTKIEYIEGPPETFRMCRHAWAEIRSTPGVMIAVAGALRLDGIPVEFIGPESVY